MNSTSFDPRSIGVFDSGLGGLTVLKALRTRFTNENFIYLGDTARIPYGTKSSRTIAKYLEQNLKFLGKQNVKAVVVACNSASTVVKDVSFEMPVYSVIEPGARTAARVSKGGRIGLIATKATVASRGYVTALENLNSNFKVFQQACPLLVPLVEEGWDDDPITNLVVYRYISPLLGQQIDTLILGCTHYPILKSTIRKVVGPNVELVESGEAVGDALEYDFANNLVKRNAPGLAGELQFLSTDVSESFQAQAQRLMGAEVVKALELVDI